DEGALELRVGDRFMSTDETGAELHPGGAHFEIGQDGLAAADPAGDEYGHLGQMRQYLLRQNRGRYRTDMAARLAALDDDGIRPHAHELLGQDQRRGKAQHPRSAGADALDRRDRRDAAGQHDMADPVLYADID